jgi:hypothetical protein
MVDICLGGIGTHGHDDDGLQAAERLRAEYPTLGLLIFSVFMSPSYLTRILSIGEHHIGYLGKDRITDFGVVVEALERVAAGGTAIDENLWVELLHHRRARGRLDKLPARKRQALGLLARAMSNKAIAEAMGGGRAHRGGLSFPGLQCPADPRNPRCQQAGLCGAHVAPRDRRPARVVTCKLPCRRLSAVRAHPSGRRSTLSRRRDWP